MVAACGTRPNSDFSQTYPITFVGMFFFNADVAVTGIPQPSENHAVTMAQFASQIVIEFDTIVAGLVEELGADTATLRLRVGCHSGPVTAGKHTFLWKFLLYHLFFDISPYPILTPARCLAWR